MIQVDPWSDAVRDKLSAALAEHAPFAPQLEARLQAAIAQSVSQPGKLVRARMILAASAAHRVDEKTGLGLATAIEYFHLASLLLDDLPCMDDASTRRGSPCVHRVHGEATAILAALALINRAYALAGFALAQQPEVVRLQAQACLDACLGTAGLIGGQAQDLRFNETARSARDVGRIALGKTGAMLWLAVVFPALLAQPDATERRALNALALYWSLALQALDDLQDVLATSVRAGKTTGRDRALARPNVAVALGVPGTLRRIVRLLAQAERRQRALVRSRPQWRYLEPFQRFFAEAAAPAVGRVAAAAA